jgi:hypothetical protein
VFQFTHDPAKARALLDEAAIAIRMATVPNRACLSLKVSTNEFIRLQAAVIQQDLKQVGIDLDVRSYEFATLCADVLKGNFSCSRCSGSASRIRHVAACVPLQADAAERIQSRLLRESGSRSADRRGDGGDDGRGSPPVYGEAQRLLPGTRPTSLWYTDQRRRLTSNRGVKLTPRLSSRSTDVTKHY